MKFQEKSRPTILWIRGYKSNDHDIPKVLSSFDLLDVSWHYTWGD